MGAGDAGAPPAPPAAAAAAAGSTPVAVAVGMGVAVAAVAAAAGQPVRFSVHMPTGRLPLPLCAKEGGRFGQWTLPLLCGVRSGCKGQLPGFKLLENPNHQ